MVKMKMPPASLTRPKRRNPPEARTTAGRFGHVRGGPRRRAWRAVSRAARFTETDECARVARARARDAAMNYKEVSYAPRGGAVRAPRSYLWVGSAKPHCEGDVSLGPSSR